MHVLVVGGGTAGTIFANNLARRCTSELKSGKVRITMLSASDRHMYQPGLLYVAMGRMTPDELYREQASLLEPGIAFSVDPVETFNLKDNHVVTKSGKTIGYDLIVICTGSRSMPELTPGLAENSVNCYTEEEALKFYDKLSAFKGGRIVITVGLPHKCPMIPLEITFTMHDFLADRGLADKTEFYYTYPIGRLHSLENVGKWAVGEFARMGVKTETLFNLQKVDAAAGKVISEEGSEVPYDLIVSVPPHKGQEVIEKNGLGQNGWIPNQPHVAAYGGRPGQERHRARRHHEYPDLEGGLDRAFRGGRRGRERRGADQGRTADAQLRRQGVLLHRSRQGPRDLRNVQLRQSAAAARAEQADARLQDGVQQALLDVRARHSVRRRRCRRNNPYWRRAARPRKMRQARWSTRAISTASSLSPAWSAARRTRCRTRWWAGSRA